MTRLMIRTEKLSELDQLALCKEFRECMNEGISLDDVLKLMTIEK